MAILRYRPRREPVRNGRTIFTQTGRSTLQVGLGRTVWCTGINPSRKVKLGKEEHLTAECRSTRPAQPQHAQFEKTGVVKTSHARKGQKFCGTTPRKRQASTGIWMPDGSILGGPLTKGQAQRAQLRIVGPMGGGRRAPGGQQPCEPLSVSRFNNLRR